MEHPRRRTHGWPLVTTLLGFLAAAPAAAQETGTPVYSAPYRAFASHELGVSLSAPPGADLGIEGFYGFASGRHDWGLRIGYLDRGERDGAVAFGARFRTRVLTHSSDFPLDGALTVGVGAAVDGRTRVRVPIGFSLGRRLDSGGISFVPYLHPVLIPTFGDGDSEFGVALGLGLDMRLGRSFDLRVSGGFGDMEGFAVSAAWVR
jgi:hypothetical protein